MFSPTESLAFIDMKSSQAPICPKEIDHTHKSKHIHLQTLIVAGIGPCILSYLIECEFFTQFEAWVLFNQIVEPQLIDKVGNIVG